MVEQPNDSILNRDEAAGNAQLHYRKQLDLLVDLSNYGSNLVLRAFNSSQRQMADIVLCGVLLKQVVAMLDATEVMLTAGCGNAAHLPARTAFEASVYIDWILVGDSELKAKRYAVSNYRDQRDWARRATPGSPEAEQLNALLEPYQIDVHAKHPELAASAAATLAEADRVLGQPSLAPVDKEFSDARGRKKHDVDWYHLDGINSLRHLSEKVGRLPEYEMFYSRGSQIMHTGTYKDHVIFTKGAMKFKPIRNLEDVGPLVSFVCSSVGIATYRKILSRYRPAELAAFGRKYLEDWRDPVLNVPRVTYNY